MDALRHAAVVLLLLWPAIARAEDRCPTPKAVARGEPLPTDPAAAADTLFAKATTFFVEKDYAAAAIVFAQAARAFEKLPDDDAHARQCTWAARSNTATAYSRAAMPVEALAAFRELLKEHEDELPPGDADLSRQAIADLSKQIGTLVLDGIPDDADVRIDGLAVPLDEARAPIALAEGTHAIEIEVRFFEVFLRDVAILGEQEATVVVELVPSEDPASVRVEANRAPARVEIDGVAYAAPIEVTLAPGPHEYVVSAPTFREHRATIDVRPGERTVLHVDLVPARAPWGARAELYGMMVFGLGAAPFDVPTPGAGALIFHPYLRFRSVWFGFGVELHARTLDNIGAGGMVKYCPESMQFWGGNLQWCPGTFAGYLTAPHEPATAELTSGYAWMRLGTSVELRAGPFAFVRMTPSVERMSFASAADPEQWAHGLGFQMSAGIEL